MGHIFPSVLISHFHYARSHPGRVPTTLDFCDCSSINSGCSTPNESVMSSSRSISSFAALGGPICVLVFSLRYWRFLCNAHVEHTNNHTYTFFRMYIPFVILCLSSGQFL